MKRVGSKRLHEPTGYVRRIEGGKFCNRKIIALRNKNSLVLRPFEFSLLRRVVSFFLFFVASSVFADIALYHTLEIDLRDPETIRIYAPIHAPELMLDKASTDFSDIGQEWLDALSDDDFATLLDRSEIFMNETMRLRLGPLNVNNGFPFSFEKSEDETAPGSLLASMEFPNPGGELRIELSPSSEKRLQVAMNVPKKFPETRDLAPGESTVILLPENPNPPRDWRGWWIALLAVPIVFFVLVWIFRKFRYR
ncbi:hypothetical protein OAE25_02775 [Verrucomicrobiales bacterium]|nr:hypothetical protein [Verrucomicrobiales bacterium]